MWHSLHVLAEVVDTMPVEMQSAAREVFIQNAIRGVGLHMPCLHCRTHALEHIVQVDPVRALSLPSKGSTPLSCLEWSHRFHTVVSKRLGRSLDKIPSLAELRTFLESLRQGHGCGDCGPVGKAPEENIVVPRGLRRQVLD